MKKIYLKVYYNCNLGDDLFIYIISKRYKNIDFITYSYMPNYINTCSNIKYIGNTIFFKMINRIIKIASKKKNNLEKLIQKKCECIIVLGGSMFIEQNHIPIKMYNDKKYYIIGTNFGPYYSKEFFNYYYSFFSKSVDVCFRENFSYNLFKKLKNVRVAPDIVFGLDTKNIKITSDKRVVISVINCEQKQCKMYKEKYENLIVDLINKFYSLNYKITLMSFCKNEGDEIAISNVIGKITNSEILDCIDKYNYRGNIEEALNILGNCQIIIGSRFHANVLGLVMNKTVIPIAYSDKTLNTLNDIDFRGKVIDIRKLDDFDIKQLSVEDFSYKININKYKNDSLKHFQELDKVLDLRGEDDD